MTTEERLLQFRVGVVVILAALIVGILIFLFGEGWTPQYTVVLRSKSAPGVTRNTPIRKNGILIGRVGRVETTDRGVLLELNIKQGEKLFQDEIAQIGTESFLGDAVIDVLPGTSEIRGAQIAHGEEMANVRVKPNPLEVVDVVIDLKAKVSDAVDAVKRAGDTVDRAGQGITQVTQRIQESIDDEDGDVRAILENVRKMTETADNTMAKLGSVLDKFDEFAGDEEFRNKLRDTVKGLPEFFEDVKTTMADARQAIQKIKEVGETADINLHNIEDFTQALGDQGPEIVAQIKSSMNGIDRLVKNVDEFAQMLNSSDGSLSRILKDPALYENLNATIQNARDVSVKLKPMMNDLRIFADSLARDPGQLGVRGAMQRRPAGSGYKGTIFGESGNDAW